MKNWTRAWLILTAFWICGVAVHAHGLWTQPLILEVSRAINCDVPVESSRPSPQPPPERVSRPGTGFFTPEPDLKSPKPSEPPPPDRVDLLATRFGAPLEVVAEKFDAFDRASRDDYFTRSAIFSDGDQRACDAHAITDLPPATVARHGRSIGEAVEQPGFTIEAYRAEVLSDAEQWERGSEQREREAIQQNRREAAVTFVVLGSLPPFAVFSLGFMGAWAVRRFPVIGRTWLDAAIVGGVGLIAFGGAGVIESGRSTDQDRYMFTVGVVVTAATWLLRQGRRSAPATTDHTAELSAPRRAASIPDRPVEASASTQAASTPDRPVEVSALRQAAPIPCETPRQAAGANSSPATLSPSRVVLGVVTAILAILIGAVISEITLGRRDPGLTMDLWIPSLVAIGSPARRTTRILAAVAGACVGGLVWGLGQAVFGNPFGTGAAVSSAFAFIASVGTAHRLCRRDDPTASLRLKPLLLLAAASLVGLFAAWAALGVATQLF